MPLNELDTEQRKAASAIGDQVAVSASAGSGKTRLLVARFLHLLQRDQLPIESVAAITFTNKAANQMKSRVAVEAARLAARDKANREFWEQAAANAHRANISTIHSFCSSLLRRYPAAAGVDPAFSVMEEAANAELRMETVRELMRERLSEGGEDMVFLLNTVGLDRLQEMLNLLLTRRPQVLKFLDALGQTPDAGLFERMYEGILLPRLEKAIGTLREFHAFRPDQDALVPVYDLVLETLEQARRAIAGDTVDCDALAAACKAINLRPGTRKWGEDILPRVKAALGETKTLLSGLESYYRRERGVAARAAALLVREFSILEDRYLNRKKDSGMLDNDDILIETWRLLRSRFDIRREISERYRHILVDEFQDTDRLQMDIIDMIAGNSATILFTVGDPKQSIYRFRGADVSVFNRYVGSDLTSFFSPSTNYRATPAVTAFVNRLFGAVMGEEPAAEYEALYRPMKTHRKDVSETPAAHIAVFTTPGGGADRFGEARFAARRIRALVADGAYSYGDIAILLRTGSSLERFEQALLSAGIPFVNRIGGKLAGSPEAFDIGNFLAWAGEPEDPALLAAVLVSPFFGFEADALYSLKVQAGSAAAMPGWLFRLAEERAPEDENGELFRAGEILAKLAAAAGRTASRDLLERAFDLTGYTLALRADPIGGLRSLAVTDLILEAVARYELAGGKRAGFAELLRSGAPFTDEAAQVETGGDAVSVMTIHGAKGLEFRAVFLADVTGAGRAGGEGILFDDALGPGFPLLSERGGTWETCAQVRIRETERAKQRAESKRLFYVGCTRARDLLVITGGPPSKSPPAETGNWMSWLYDALDLPLEGEEDRRDDVLFTWRRFIAGEPGEPGDAAPREREPNGVGATAGKSILREVADAPILPIGAPALPGTVSVSALLDFHEDPARYVRRHVLGMDPEADRGGDGYGREYGIFVHRVLERIDLRAPERWGEVVRATGEELRIPAFLREKGARALAVFGETALVRAAGRAPVIEREQPFVLAAGEVLVRGTIDLTFTSDTGGLVLVDFKTGGVPAGDSPVLDRYRLQLAIYALAAWRATGRLPETLALAFVDAGETVSIPVTESLLDQADRTIMRILGDMAVHPLP